MSVSPNLQAGDPALVESASSKPTDEADLAGRHYVSKLSDEKISEYRQAMTDEQVVEWCGDFRNDGALMLVCVERDVGVTEFRRVLEEFIQYRGLSL